MDIPTYSKEYAPLISNVLTALGLMGLLIAAFQLRSSRLWNRLHSAFTFLPNPLELESIEAELDESIGFWRKDAPIDEKLAKALFGDLEDTELTKLGRPKEELTETKRRHLAIGRKLKLYVNLIEMYCVAINAGVVDRDVAFHIYRFKFTKHYRKLEMYIKYVRTKQHDDSIYCELTEVVRKWNAKTGTKKRF